jgi:hypothetical protein
MGTKEKLIERLRRKPKDFTFDEAVTVLGFFGYSLHNKGTTSGSRVLFAAPGRTPIMLHKPHPQKVLKSYAVEHLLEKLILNGDISK